MFPQPQKSAFEIILDYYFQQNNNYQAICEIIKFVTNFDVKASDFPNLTTIFSAQKLSASLLLNLVNFIDSEAEGNKKGNLPGLQIAYCAYIKTTKENKFESITLEESKQIRETESLIYEHFMILIFKASEEFPLEQKLLQEELSDVPYDIEFNKKKKLYINLTLKLFLENAKHKNPRANYWFDVLMALPDANVALVNTFHSLEEGSEKRQIIYDFLVRYKGHKQDADFAGIIPQQFFIKNAKSAGARPTTKWEQLDNIFKHSGVDEKTATDFKEIILVAYEKDSKEGRGRKTALRQASREILQTPVCQQAKARNENIYEKILKLWDKINSWINSLRLYRHSYSWSRFFQIPSPALARIRQEMDAVRARPRH